MSTLSSTGGTSNKPEDLMELVASASEHMPDNIEYALYAYIQKGFADYAAIREIILAYRTGNVAAARILVDALDGSIDGQLFNLPLDRGNVPRPKRHAMHDPGEGDATSGSRYR